MTDPLLSLAERVEGAMGPDRRLDAEIAPLIWLRVVDEGHPLGICCYDASGRRVVLPSFTRSIDAAETLVPEGWCWTLNTFGDPARSASAYVINSAEVQIRPAKDYLATPALALTAAALRAHAAMRGEG